MPDRYLLRLYNRHPRSLTEGIQVLCTLIGSYPELYLKTWSNYANWKQEALRFFTAKTGAALSSTVK